MKIYFTTDYHYDHQNIAGPNLSRWDKGYRDFESVSSMNDAIVNSTNDIVKENDILYYLGDWSFGHHSNILELRKRLKVKTIHFILGNHDKYITRNSHLFTSVQDYLEINIHGQDICLFHYPIQEWNKCHRNSWMLCGHSHGMCEYSNSLTSTKKILDVGWDCFRKPLSFQEIRKIMSTKGIKEHH